MGHLRCTQRHSRCQRLSNASFTVMNPSLRRLVQNEGGPCVIFASVFFFSDASQYSRGASMTFNFHCFHTSSSSFHKGQDRRSGRETATLHVFHSNRAKVSIAGG